MKYKVIVLALSSIHPQVLVSGDIVDETYFPEGNVPALIDGGFLEEYNGDVAVGQSTKIDADTELDNVINSENEVKHTVTKDDLKNNPELGKSGIKAGDVINYIPESKK